MEEKINRKLLLMGVLAAVLTLILTATAFSKSYDERIRDDLSSQTDMLAAAYSHLEDTAQLKDFASLPIRITLVDTDGQVLFETDAASAEMENHLERPEIQEALSEGSGSSQRYSRTLGIKEYYEARRLDDGRVLRCSLSADIAGKMIWACLPYLLLILIALLALSVLLSSLLTKRLVRPIKQLAERIDDPELVAENSTAIYRELVPFVREIQTQRAELREQMLTIEHEHRRLAAILEHMEEGLLLLDMQKRVLIANDSVRQILHISGDAIGQHLIELSRNRYLLDAAKEATENRHSAFDMECDGRLFHVMVNPVLQQDEPIGVICLLIDVTERRQIERMKQEFTANVSHELKTPLTSISGYAEMIENGMASPQDIPVFAQRIQKEAARLLSLIRDIIKLSEIEEIGGGLTMDTVDLYAAAECSLQSLRQTAEARKIRLKLEGTSCLVNGNQAMLEELIYNLCDNAVRYNRDGGEVTATVENHSVSVADTGIGIPAEHQGRIFERFYRVDKSRSKETGGTGLGLAIVKHIAQVHHAVISLESRETVGTCITVTFPAE